MAKDIPCKWMKSIPYISSHVMNENESWCSYTLDKIDFKIKTAIKDKEGPYIDKMK